MKTKDLARLVGIESEQAKPNNFVRYDENGEIPGGGGGTTGESLILEPEWREVEGTTTPHLTQAQFDAAVDATRKGTPIVIKTVYEGSATEWQTVQTHVVDSIDEDDPYIELTIMWITLEGSVIYYQIYSFDVDATDSFARYLVPAHTDYDGKRIWTGTYELLIGYAGLSWPTWVHTPIKYVATFPEEWGDTRAYLIDFNGDSEPLPVENRHLVTDFHDLQISPDQYYDGAQVSVLLDDQEVYTTTISELSDGMDFEGLCEAVDISTIRAANKVEFQFTEA